MRLFFCNAPYLFSETDIRAKFEQFGIVHTCQLITDHATSRSRGFGFVTMNREEAVVAMASLDGKWIRHRKVHRKLVVKEFVRKERSDHDERPDG